MSHQPSILPDEKAFEDFKKQCESVGNWSKKYEKNDMQVYVEVPAGKGKTPQKVHKIKVSLLMNFLYFWCELTVDS